MTNNIKTKLKHKFEQDNLKIIQHVKNLHVLLHKIHSPATLAINGSWGSGKTTFIALLRNEIEGITADNILENLDKEGKISLYFSAWENDNLSDPFTDFLVEIDRQIQIVKNSKEWKDYIEKASFILNIIAQVSKVFGPALAPIDAVNTIFKNIIAKYDEYKKSIDNFKNNLKSIIEKSQHDTIYIFIDELDRCRPTYAIELLETIKHLFDIEGIIFILAINEEQLCHSIKTLYGNEFNAKHYLKRFIDYKYNLPEPDNYIEFIRHNFKQKELGIEEEIQGLTELLDELIKSNTTKDIKIERTLRDIEQIISQFTIAFLYLNKETIEKFTTQTTYVNPYQILLIQIYINNNQHFKIENHESNSNVVFFLRAMIDNKNISNDLNKMKDKLVSGIASHKENEKVIENSLFIGKDFIRTNIFDNNNDIYQHLEKIFSDNKYVFNDKSIKFINLLHLFNRKGYLKNNNTYDMELKSIIDKYKHLYEEIKKSLSLAANFTE